MKKKISLRVIRRISFYYEALLKLNLPEDAYVSSKKLEDVTGVSCNQVRQDFFYLGISIGKQKKGYQVHKLFLELKKNTLHRPRDQGDHRRRRPHRPGPVQLQAVQ